MEKRKKLRKIIEKVRILLEVRLFPNSAVVVNANADSFELYWEVPYANNSVIYTIIFKNVFEETDIPIDTYAIIITKKLIDGLLLHIEKNDKLFIEGVPSSVKEKSSIILP